MWVLSPPAPSLTFLGALYLVLRGPSPFTVDYTADAVALQAHNDAIAAYGQLSAQGPGTILADSLGPATVLGPGIYSFATGTPDLPAGATLTLNDPTGNGIFVFNVGASLTFNVGSSVVGTANPCNIYWRVGTSATLNGTTFRGTVIAGASITVGAGANVAGRLLTTGLGPGATGAITMAGAGGNTIGLGAGCIAAGGGGGGGGGAVCVSGGNAPTITTIPSQVIPTLPVGGSVAVGFTISGAVITDALGVSATSANTTLVPPSAMVITKGVGGARVLTVRGADGRTGVTTITVTVTDSQSNCSTSTSFQLTIGAAAVPTLPQWAMIALMALLAIAGFVAVRRRTT